MSIIVAVEFVRATDAARPDLKVGQPRAGRGEEAMEYFAYAIPPQKVFENAEDAVARGSLMTTGVKEAKAMARAHQRALK